MTHGASPKRVSVWTILFSIAFVDFAVLFWVPNPQFNARQLCARANAIGTGINGDPGSTITRNSIIVESGFVGSRNGGWMYHTVDGRTWLQPAILESAYSPVPPSFPKVMNLIDLANYVLLAPLEWWAPFHADETSCGDVSHR